MGATHRTEEIVIYSCQAVHEYPVVYLTRIQIVVGTYVIVLKFIKTALVRYACAGWCWGTAVQRRFLPD